MMFDARIVEMAQAIPFSRTNAANVIGVPVSKLSNWIDRNQLWQGDRGRGFHRTYTIKEIFDLSGFAQMRLARIPEQQCARFVYNFGFYRRFIHFDLDNNQSANFSMRGGIWQIGVFDPNALLTITINVRELGLKIFQGIATCLERDARDWPAESASCFHALYRKAVDTDRLSPNLVPFFDGFTKLP